MTTTSNETTRRATRALLPRVALLALAATAAGGCREPDFDGAREKYFTPVHTDLTYLRDGMGRYVYLRGVNVSGSNKVPASTDPVSYVGKPFPIAEADRHFQQLADGGFNSIRLLLIWEAIQPDGPGSFDEEYLDFIEQVVAKAAEYGIYVLVDMHQDIWSRHLVAKFNDRPTYVDGAGNEVTPPKGSLEAMLLGLVPDDEGNYSDQVSGDGAPRWAIEACLPERNLDSPWWGTPRLLGQLDDETLTQLIGLLQTFLPSGMSAGGAADTSWLMTFVDRLPPQFPFEESNDMLPWTTWGLNVALSLDVQRCVATFFAGDKLYPSYRIDGKNARDYLQDAYTASWLEVARRVKNYPNVIGYDIMNEPPGAFITFAAAALYFQTGMDEGAQRLMESLLGTEMGPKVFSILTSLELLPPDRSPETIRRWGFEGADLGAMVDVNNGFDQKYLQPLFEKVGAAIQAEDPDAKIWIEGSLGLNVVLGSLGGGWLEINMRKPAGLRQVVYAPHWYPDIYPMIGFNMPPRDFTAEEVRFRDYRPGFQAIVDRAAYSLGNVPVVIGEFGTYFNFGGIDRSIEEGYAVSAQILDNHYEAHEAMLSSSLLWCWSPENDERFGEGWNKEDFSIVDPDLKPRAEKAWSRPYPRAVSGKPLSMHFYSDYHYFDPDKGEANPKHEFELTFGSKETDAPTEIFVPGLQYPRGVYVWLSDGYAVYDGKWHILYYFPERDEPGWVHSVRLRPPLQAGESEGWDYFVDVATGRVVSGK